MRCTLWYGRITLVAPFGRGEVSLQVPTARAFRGFAKLLASDANALEELFTATFELLDFFWLQQRASYMEFPQVPPY
jgi:hypothetical protein